MIKVTREQERERGGRLKGRSPELERRRLQFEAKGPRGLSSIYDWTESLLAPEEQVERFDAATGELQDGVAIANQRVWGDPLARRLQLKAARLERGGAKDPHAIAEEGLRGSASKLPHLERIQASFGHHDLSHVKAHLGSAAADASERLGARAYATGDAVAFGGAPDLHTAAHEAAHVVQQQAGVSLKDGVGQVGDVYERHADAVADLVVRGESAQGLLDQMSGGAGGPGAGGVQRRALQLDPDDEEDVSEAPDAGVEEEPPSAEHADPPPDPDPPAPQESGTTFNIPKLASKGGGLVKVRLNAVNEVEVEEGGAWKPLDANLAGDLDMENAADVAKSELQSAKVLATALKAAGAASSKKSRQQEQTDKVETTDRHGNTPGDANSEVTVERVKKPLATAMKGLKGEWASSINVRSPLWPVWIFFARLEGSLEAGLEWGPKGEAKFLESAAKAVVDAASGKDEIDVSLGTLSYGISANVGGVLRLQAGYVVAGLELQAKLAAESKLGLEVNPSVKVNVAALRDGDYAKVLEDFKVDGSIGGAVDIYAQGALNAFLTLPGFKPWRQPLIESDKFCLVSWEPGAKFWVDRARTPTTGIDSLSDFNDSLTPKFNVAKTESGLTAGLVNWAQADDRAHAIIVELGKHTDENTGLTLLDALPEAAKGKLLDDLHDGATTGDHDESFVAVLRATRDPLRRLVVLLNGYRSDKGSDPGCIALYWRDAILGWISRAIDGEEWKEAKSLANEAFDQLVFLIPNVAERHIPSEGWLDDQLEQALAGKQNALRSLAAKNEKKLEGWLNVPTALRNVARLDALAELPPPGTNAADLSDRAAELLSSYSARDIDAAACAGRTREYALNVGFDDTRADEVYEAKYLSQREPGEVVELEVPIERPNPNVRELGKRWAQVERELIEQAQSR